MSDFAPAHELDYPVDLPAVRNPDQVVGVPTAQDEQLVAIGEMVLRVHR
jgi:hypothetical protein